MYPDDGSQQLPSHPKFSWDIKFVPWTDVKGDQHEYFKAVNRRCYFQDNLRESTSNGIDKNIEEYFFSKIYIVATELCEGIVFEKIASEKGLDLILAQVYKRDPLSVVSLVFYELKSLLSVRHEKTEQFSDFEVRFGAQLAKLNSLGKTVSMTGSVASLVLLANFNVDSSKPISILAAAAPNNISLTTSSTTDEFIKSVKY